MATRKTMKQMLASKQSRGKLNFDKLPKRVALSFINQPVIEEITTAYDQGNSSDGNE